MTEKQIQNEIFLTYGAVPYMRIWRVNVGMGYPFYLVRALIEKLMRGDFQGAIKIGRSMNPIKFGTKGQSDIMGILKGGRLVGIEVKTETGKQRPDQVQWQTMIEFFGGLYILARSVEDVEFALKKNGVV